MVLSPEQLDSLAQPHAAAVGALEDIGWSYIIQTLAKYGVQNADQSPDDWKQELLQHAADITKYMTKQSADTFTPIVNQVSTSIRKAPLEDQHDVLQWLGKISGKVGQSGTVAESRAVNRLVTNAQRETDQYLNLAKRNMNRNATAAFKRIVSDSALAMKNGMPRDKALLIASRRWSMRGVPALIDKAGKSWQPDVYMRLVVTNQAKQTSNLIALQHAKDFGAFVKVSSHAACRPTHLPYQGRIYSVNGDTSEYPDLYSSTSYGSAGGLCGINCHHYVMPYVPSYGTPDVDSLNPDENNERYQLTQKQRSLERSVRAAKRNQHAAHSFGDEFEIMKADREVLLKQAKLRELISANSSILRRDYSREGEKTLRVKTRSFSNLLKGSKYVQNISEYRPSAVSAMAKPELQAMTLRTVGSQIRDSAFLRERLSKTKLSINFDSATFAGKTGVIGAVSVRQKAVIHLNPEYYQNKAILRAFVSSPGFVRVPQSRLEQYPVVHELGHVLHNELWEQYREQHSTTKLSRADFVAGELDKIYNIYRQQNRSAGSVIKPVSWYADKKSFEEFAELFVAARIGVNSLWARAMREYLKGVW